MDTSPNTVHSMTGVDIMHDTLGYDGTGIKVGVIDSGVDYTHPAFGGCQSVGVGPGCRVKFGYDFVGDDFSSGSSPVKKPSPDPQDRCSSGHGTHVAGTIAAFDNKYGMRGVAPGATIGAYKVFSCAETGPTDDDAIISAMERAHNDGMDVINLSLGANAGWEGGAVSHAASLLTQKGTMVVASAGNSGDHGLWEIAGPSIGRDVLSVASFDNTAAFFTKSFKLSSDPNSRFGHNIPLNPKATGGWKDIPIVELVDADGDKEACGPITMDVKGKIALIKRGGCEFEEKAKAAITDHGAAGIIFYNNRPVLTWGPIGGNFGLAIYLITQHYGEQMVSIINAGKADGKDVTISDTDDTVSHPLDTAGTVSYFSSYGPGTLLELKPEVGAPGGAIFSTVPLRMSPGYAIFSGTSMSAPYVSGSLALLKQVLDKKTTYAEFFTRLIATASPRKRYSNGEEGEAGIETVARQGGGMINVLDALASRTMVVPGRLALNDSVVGGPRENRVYKLTVHNYHSEKISYEVSHKPAESAAPFGSDSEFLTKPEFSPNSAQIKVFPKRIIVPPKGKKSVEVRFTEPGGLSKDQLFVFSGYIEFIPHRASAVRVPYSGLLGDYRKFPILDPSSSSAPYLFDNAKNKAIIPGEVDPNNPPKFTMVGNSTVSIYARLIHPTRMLRVRVLDASKSDGGGGGSSSNSSEKSVGFIDKDGIIEYSTRCTDSDPRFCYQYEWDGLVIQAGGQSQASKVPNGEYQIRIEALKPFGNVNKDEDYETVLLPKIAIVRPAPS
ncbi:subtilisin-like protein [Ramicandelaber brevisporus]|nr:subtilisin-like protein [Ramicandelaber brevisporus]KAI8873331.1 subtilisin-like protein [Ramicandelaber brevisporus]